MQFLVEFIQENRETLPHRAHADKLGRAGAGLVLPAGAVRFAEPVRYTGSPAVRIGSDASAYTTGGVDGKARGGDALTGTLLLAGEAMPEFKHAGSRLRVLWVDAGASLPLGAEARTPACGLRAEVLERAWELGAGLFGARIAGQLWADWPGYVAKIRALESAAALQPLGPWREPLAAVAAAL